MDPKQRTSIVKNGLDRIHDSLSERFKQGKRVLSYGEYMDLFAEDPARFGRDAATYVRDMFDHYGTVDVQKAWGKETHFRLFDLAWEKSAVSEGPNGAPPPRDVVRRDSPLVGHEEIQAAIYRSLANFVKEGRANRLILMHGPNGSAKSTTAACILRALEHYSTLDEGAVYRFHWVFPSRKTTRGAIGFGDSDHRGHGDETSFAHLADDQIDARLVMEVRDHPLFLIPLEERRRLLDEIYGAVGKPIPAWLYSGQLSHKSQQVFEALMMAEQGSLHRVLRHVQVERFFISRRYRVGAVTLGPEVSVDAGERQITADRSLAALPTALQATTLFEAHGELIEAGGGVLEFSDILKRPIDAFRYLQLTLETGEVALPHQTIATNLVMIGSANEIHLAAFREHPEFPSFRGRFELVPVPYLRSYVDEQKIYDTQIAPYVGKHVAPHATRVAAEFAVLTRLMKPKPESFPDELGKLVRGLDVEAKLELYATGIAPESLDTDAKKVLQAGIEKLYTETEAHADYEGSLGASPRTMRTVLLNAAQSREYAGLSPFAVMAELDELCRLTSEYDFLREKALAGGYHDTKELRTIVRRRLLDRIEEEMRIASGLVDEQRYGDLFDRYVSQVTSWVKGESIRNAMTGEYSKADERLMQEVEALLEVTAKPEDHRRGLISSIAAWAIDHPGQRVVNAVVFPDYLKRIKESVFEERKKPVAQIVRDLVQILRLRKENKAPADKDLAEARRREALRALERLKTMGYDDDSALDAATFALRERYAGVLG